MAITLLEDAYEVSGRSESDFYQHLAEFDSCTEHRKVSDGVRLLSFVGVEDDHLIYRNTEIGITVSPAIIDIKNGVSESFVTELQESKAPVIYFNSDGTWAFSNNRAVSEIAAAFGFTGSMLTEPEEHLHKYLTYLSEKRELTFILRKHGSYSKVMSIRTGKYHKINMVESFESIDTFCERNDVGMSSVKEFVCNQNSSAISIQFPYLTEDVQQKYSLKTPLIAGIKVTNNDLGYSTLSYQQLFYRDNGSTRPYEVGDPCVAKHTGGFNLSTYVDRVSKEIWEKLSEVPQALSEAMAHPVSDVDAFIEKIFLHIHLYKVFQKKTTESCRYIENFRTMLNQEMASITNPSAYDVIVAVMDAPDTLKGKIPDSYYKQFEHACSSAFSVALP